ncbi:hypothetical protein V2J09_004469 [Rumex salicifolius]
MSSQRARVVTDGKGSERRSKKRHRDANLSSDGGEFKDSGRSTSKIGRRGGKLDARGGKRSESAGRVAGNADKARGMQASVSGISLMKEKTVSQFMNLVGDEDAVETMDLDDIEIARKSALFHKDVKVASVQPSSLVGDNSHLSETRFDQCAVSPLTLRGIKDIGFGRMTMVQEATLPAILKGKDVMAKAKTGTGKTVAFLLPSIEVVVKSPIDRNQKILPIHVLVVCPTRELASQAAAEAKSLLKYHPSIGVQVVIGGTKFSTEQKSIKAKPCQILIATPGRLVDHIANTSRFAMRLMGVKILVLDEADRLLDMGFRKDLDKIIAAVPKKRQTLLFSATIPEEVQKISKFALKSDHEYINTVEEGDGDTHAKVNQMHIISPLKDHFPLLYALLKKHISEEVNYKVIVFCTTAMVTKLVAEILGELNMNVREIHSRKNQGQRTKVSNEFRASNKIILVSSDVSARGVDYPDVTLVIQMGLPSDKEQYIHRLGRTGRKGKEGQGILVLAPWEEFFLSSVQNLPIPKGKEPVIDPQTKEKVERAISKVGMKTKDSAYQSWLGYYNSNRTVSRSKDRLIMLSKDFSSSMGLEEVPYITRKVAGKMGLRDVPDPNIML